MKRPLGWLLLFGPIALGLPGCANCCRRAAPPPPPPPVISPVSPTPAFQPLPPGPQSPPTFQSPPAFSSPAPGLQPPHNGVPQAPPPPVQVSPDVRSYGPATTIPPAGTWTPAPRPDVHLNVPQPSAPEQQAGARLGPPVTAPEQATPGPARPEVAEDRSPTPPLPVGIPQFALAKDQVATGLKPLLDGLDWLQTHGYRTVLHVRPPGEDDSADRKQVEKRGLQYVSLEVSPATLNRGVVESFNRVVASTAYQPLFVYDREGMLVGALWYLHFRTVDGATDAVARTKAARLGLKDDPNGDHRLMWLAIQRFLSEPTR